MKKHLVKFIFEIIGYISAAIGIIILSLIIYSYFDNFNENKNIKLNDAIYALNRPNLKDRMNGVKLIYGYKSPRSFTGDHYDCFHIKFDSITDFPSEKDYDRYHWTKGLPDNPIYIQAIEQIYMFDEIKKIPSFPSKEMIKKGNYYIYIPSAKITIASLIAAEITILDLENKDVFHISWKI